MHTVFTTENVPAGVGFKLWRQSLERHTIPATQRPLGEGPFRSTVEATSIADLRLTRIRSSPLLVEVDGAALQRHGRADSVAVYMLLAGTNGGAQYGRESRQRAGDIVMYDGLVSNIHVGGDVDLLVLEIPRTLLETAAGSTKLVTAVTMDGALGSTALALAFFQNLLLIEDRLDGPARARLAPIGVDLILAAAAERFSREDRSPSQGRLIVERAKAYIEAHCSDPHLDPAQVASMARVSLRRLQSAFQEKGCQVADWIWQRRLEKAAAALRSPANLHKSIGLVSYEYGFVNQSHFSTRFRQHHGVTPKDYRDRAFNR